MSEMIRKRCVGTDVQVKCEPGQDTLHVDYTSIERYLARAEEKYNRCREDYFNTLPTEDKLLRKSKRWERAALDYLRWAETFFDNCDGDNEKRQYALDIIDRVTKEAAVRHENIITYVDKLTDNVIASNKSEEEKEDIIDDLDAIEHASGSHVRNLMKTQQHFIRLNEKGENYVSQQQEQEIAAAARVAELRERYFPKDHVYLPGRIIPPHRTPMTDRVPDCPKAYEKAENQPIDAYTWNEELDEVVIKPGYISEDGLIDDQSVVIDPVNNKVTIKFRGGEPVVWDWWKPKDTYDLPERGSWVEEYLIRSYAQMIADYEPGILKHRDYEDEVPEYDKIPESSGQ